MCGIVGKVYRDPSRAVDSRLLEAMHNCIVHRGPDDSGLWTAPPAGFGFRRLSIIDLATGHQPMLNEDGTVAIVFNGEIYNYTDLRKLLVDAGHVFTTNSDTETILHGYEQWGTGVASRLRGMFAFAVFDTKMRTLYAARDRVGKKPLYYARVRPGTADEAIVFASELKSILADPGFERQVDFAALSHYLTYQYVPHPWSIFEGAKKLPPGHWMTWRDGELRIERYWELVYGPKLQISEEEAIERTLAEMDEAVRIRLMSEVPLGCFLSGGIDSSTVVAMMRRHIPGDLKTFSIGFREEKFNELPYARQVARQFETHHEEFIVEADAFECVGELAWHYDEPFADSSAIPTYYLSKLTRQYVTVALNGDGGDESFAGYWRYRGIDAVRRYRMIPPPLRVLANTPFRAMANMLPDSQFWDSLAYGNEMSLMSDERLYTQLMVFFREYQKRELVSAQWRHVLNETEADSESLTVDILCSRAGDAWVDRMMYSDIMLYLPGALLPKVDRATMAHSLEGRSPFLDQKLMEFAARLPAEMKFGQDRTLKRLLKKALLRYFPQEFLERPKMGFGVPIGDWFRDELRDVTHEFLLGERARARGYFDHAYLERLVKQHMSGKQNHHNRIWALIMFEAWCRTFLDRAEPLSGPIRV